MWRDFSKALREIWEASGGGASSYRPERHYMRGPGPKWRAKHAGLLSSAPQLSAKAARPVLNSVAQHRA